MPRLARCLQQSQPASTQPEIDAGVATPPVSARAFPDLRDGCWRRARHGHAVAAALHVAERALRTFDRGYERRCHCGRQHEKHDEGGEGGDGAHGPSSLAHFHLPAWRGAVPLRANVRFESKAAEYVTEGDWLESLATARLRFQHRHHLHYSWASTLVGRMT
jgi:hypothetical protein